MKKSSKKVSVHIDPVQEQKDIQRRMLILAACIVVLSLAVLFLWWKAAANGVLMAVTEEDADVVPGSEIKKSKIRNIIFQSDFSGETDDAWDVSAAGDGSVMAWVVENSEATGQYDLYIGAKGGVKANPDSSYLFYNYAQLKEIRFDGCFDTSDVTNMSYLFAESFISSVDLSSLDTSNVINMSYMFSGFQVSAPTIIGTIDTSSVTDMSYMFYNCVIDLEEISELIRGMDTSKVQNMSHMFANCWSTVTLDLRSFDTSSVTDMSGMFEQCPMLETLDIAGFDTSNVTTMAYMFYACVELESLDVSGFDTSKVTDMSYMFYNCLNLDEPDISGFVMEEAETESMTGANLTE